MTRVSPDNSPAPALAGDRRADGGADRRRGALRGCLRDRTGAVAVLTAIAMVAICGFAGVAIDIAMWETAQRHMQGAADQAAFAAAVAAGPNGNGEPYAMARATAASMSFPGGTDVTATGCTTNSSTQTKVCVNNPPNSGRYGGNSNGWEVVITQPQPLWLASLYLSSKPVAEARAVAHAQASSSPYCILALDPTDPSAISLQNTSTSVNVSTCSIQANSNNSAAMAVSAGTTLIADTVSVTGNLSISQNATYTVNNTDAPGAEPFPDPYANATVPSYSCAGSPNKNISTIEPTPVPPGAYCNGMTFNGNTNQQYLLSGVYIVDGKNSSFNVLAGATVSTCYPLPCSTGSATIILTNGASVTINGGTVNLVAPTTSPASGVPAGLVFFQDRSDTAPAKLAGGASQSYTGALYFPNAPLTITGSSGTSQCTQIVAYTISFQGTSTTQYSPGCGGTTNIKSYQASVAE